MCEFCKKLFLTSDELTRHDQDECSMKIIECPLPQIGCQEKVRFKRKKKFLFVVEIFVDSSFDVRIFINIFSVRHIKSFYRLLFENIFHRKHRSMNFDKFYSDSNIFLKESNWSMTKFDV